MRAFTHEREELCATQILGLKNLSQHFEQLFGGVGLCQKRICACASDRHGPRVI